MKIDPNKKYFYIIMHRNEPYPAFHMLSRTGIAFMISQNRFRVALFETRKDAEKAVNKAKARYGSHFEVYKIKQEGEATYGGVGTSQEAR